ncbi:transporter [Algoriphagus sp. CAU 1675]|uniref:transporter n=1 Tax=Algoriphagus sp. CAU 1675 TaxID=3032597 RepID=UPI0023DB22F9|nr:transporter [Algoriphagus sp. CAU 1675]MDF2158922.1 transporter [Algoriphagus sp. CAU 1675]
MNKYTCGSRGLMKTPVREPKMSLGTYLKTFKLRYSVFSWLTFAFCLIGQQALFAQSPTDGLMMPKGEICVLANYEFGHFDHYWEGSFLRENQTIATVHRKTALAMAAYGISQKLNVYLGVPFVSTNSTRPNGGKFAGVSGLQDLTIALKYEALKSQVGNGELSGYASLAFSSPVSNYLSDYQPYSLGLGTQQLSWRALLKYKWNSGFYIRATSAYIWRGYTQAEREYYYNNGSYYTTWMDVPSSWNHELVVGKWFFGNSLRLEMNLSSLRSTSGDDIRAYNAPQPTNKVNMDRVGGFVQYYFSSIKGLGVLAYYNRVFQGRNAPELSTLGAGITYQFKL